MIRIKDYKKEKAMFKKLFKHEDMLFLKIKPYGKNNVSIIISSDNVEYEIEAKTDYPIKHICLSFISPLDCVFDIIFSKDGFYIETYKNAYTELETVSISGTVGYISQVIFKSKTKVRDFIVPCNYAYNIIYDE